MLLTLITLISSGSLLGAAIMAASREQAEVSGYVLTVVIGLVLAFINYSMMLQLAGPVARAVASHSPRWYIWYGRTLYGTAALWMFIAPFVSLTLTVAALRFIF